MKLSMEQLRTTRITERLEEFVQLRRDIHAHPELCFQESRTSQLIAEKLNEWGIEVHTGLGGTGVVGLLRNGTVSRMIGLRADMDALPIHEANTFPHHSENTGVMHACGHDGHVAMLLSAAQALAENPDFNGTVCFIFQPGEESGIGAKKMIEDGLFELFPCDAVFALHNWPGIPVGQFATCPGPIMASCNEFRIMVSGKGAHAALPHDGYDPVYAAVQIFNGLQSIITRNKRPLDSAVLSITQIQAGDATNIIPESTSLAGTVRTFDPSTVDLIEKRIREIASLTAEAHRCTAAVEFVRQSPATINDPDQTRFAVEVMRKVVGLENVNEDAEPTMGAEDFSFMLQKIPGCYAFIGNGDGGHREKGHGFGPCSLHNPSYDFNDSLLPLGTSYWISLVKEFLK